MLASLLNTLTSTLIVTPCDDGTWQASLHRGGNSYRVRIEQTAAEAIESVLLISPPPPY